MATQIEKKTFYSVADAADALGVTVGRIRQLLGSDHNAHHEFATKLNRDWVMTEKQVEKLRKLRRELFQKKFGRLPDDD